MSETLILRVKSSVKRSFNSVFIDLSSHQVRISSSGSDQKKVMKNI